MKKQELINKCKSLGLPTFKIILDLYTYEEELPEAIIEKWLMPQQPTEHILYVGENTLKQMNKLFEKIKK